MGATWTFPAPSFPGPGRGNGSPAGEGWEPGARLELSASEGWPLDQLDPKVLMLLQDSLQEALASLDLGPAAGPDRVELRRRQPFP